MHSTNTRRPVTAVRLLIALIAAALAALAFSASAFAQAPTQTLSMDPPQEGQPISLEIDISNQAPNTQILGYDWFVCPAPDWGGCVKKTERTRTITPTASDVGKYLYVEAELKAPGGFSTWWPGVYSQQVLAAPPVGSVEQAQLNSGPVALYAFEQGNGAFSSSVPGVPDMTGGDAMTTTAGLGGSTGLQMRRDIIGPGVEDAALNSQQFTIEYWAFHEPQYPDDNTLRRVMSKNDAQGKSFIRTTTSQSKIACGTPTCFTGWGHMQLGFNADANNDNYFETSANASGSAPFKPYEWHHYAYTIGANSWQIYRDGKQVGNYSGALTVNTKAGRWTIGGYNAPGVVTGPQAVIDNVAFYNRALTAAEILAHWESRPTS